MNNQIEKKITELKSKRDEHIEISYQTMKADNGALFPLDFLAIAVHKRSISIINGFCDLLTNNNFICAAPLIRLQIDNLIRLFAATLVENPHTFTNEVISGKHIRNIKDRNGNKMTDFYLVNLISKEHEWIENVYKETSGFIHLSDKHIFSSISKVKKEKDLLLQFKVGKESEKINDEPILEAIEAMLRATEILLSYLNNWVITKNFARQNDE